MVGISAVGVALHCGWGASAEEGTYGAGSAGKSGEAPGTSATGASRTPAKEVCAAEPTGRVLVDGIRDICCHGGEVGFRAVETLGGFVALLLTHADAEDDEEGEEEAGDDAGDDDTDKGSFGQSSPRSHVGFVAA